MQIVSAPGNYHKIMIDDVCIARANKQTGTEETPNDPHWIVYPPNDSGRYDSSRHRRVDTEEAAVSLISMICVMKYMGI